MSQPLWMQVNELFHQHGLKPPPWRLRDEIVGLYLERDRLREQLQALQSPTAAEPSPPQDWIERCAKVADEFAAIYCAPAGGGYSYGYMTGKKEAGMTIAKSIRALALLPTPPKESETR